MASRRKEFVQSNLQHMNQILSARRSRQLSTLQEASETTSQFEHVAYEHVDDLPFLPINSLAQGAQSEVDCVVGEAGDDGIPTVELARKIIHLRGSRRRQLLSVLHEEVGLMKSLVHQHIIQITSTYETLAPPRQFGILMFPVGDENISCYLEAVSDKGYPKKDIQRLEKWLLCLASALDYVHSQGIRHQDIKPQHIICQGGKIFLTDFGSTYKFLRTESRDSAGENKYMYSAPETISQGRRERCSDIFSLGCVYADIATVITSRKPQDFHAYRTASVFDLEESPAGQKSPPPFSATQSKLKAWFKNSSWPEIYDLLKVMLSNDPEKRPRAYEVVATFVAASKSTHPICPCVHGPIVLPEYWDLSMEFELLPGLIEHPSPGSTFGLTMPNPEDVLETAKLEAQALTSFAWINLNSEHQTRDEGIQSPKTPDLLSSFLALMDDPENEDLKKRYNEAEAVSLLEGRHRVVGAVRRTERVTKWKRESVFVDFPGREREGNSVGRHYTNFEVRPLAPPERPRRDFLELQPLMVEADGENGFPEFI